MMTNKIVPSSFRDPSGFVFYRNGSLCRQINSVYKDHYDHFISSGLYEKLTQGGLLIPHDEVELEYALSDKAYKVIEPQVVPFISYPHEWCFSQLKDAALLTLEIQNKSMDFGMSLKDCSAYNIQFVNGKPVFIDTLSFERYREGQPWVAYKQFCQHFLAPLALMARKDIRLNQLFRVYMDGIPLDLASSLLPFRTWFTFSLLNHIHLHAKSQEYFSDKEVTKYGGKVSRLSFLGIIDSLTSAVKKLKWRPRGTEWAEYYEDTNYSSDALEHKSRLVANFLDKVNPKLVWDLGANIGIFSRIPADKGIQTLSFDIDTAAVEKNYIKCAEDGELNVLPLLLDLANPSPGIGWENQERMSLIDRGPADTVLALAVLHHLVISNNLPFAKIANFFSKICKALIIEFVPKHDSQVQRLLSTREDIFIEYNQRVFEETFSRFFKIESSKKIRESERMLYLMRRKEACL